jgi:exodeoxyribonuclease VII large subunit
VPDIADMREALMNLEIRAGQALRREFKALRQRLLELSRKRVLQSPKNYIDDKRMLLGFQSSRLAAAASKKFSVSRERYVRLAAALDAMSPLKVLGRGYAIACGPEGVIKKASDVKSGDKIKIRLRKDEISATAD